MGHLPGYLILATSAVLTALAVVYRFVTFRNAWRGAKTAFGVPVRRFDAEGRELAELGPAYGEVGRAIERIHDYLETTDYPPLEHLCIELVPRGHVRSPSVPFGRLRDGRIVRASVRVEHMFPLPGFPRRYVAIVEDDPDAAFALVVHEWTRHILPFSLGRGFDPAHSLGEFDVIERILQ